MLHGPYRSLGLFPIRYTVLVLCFAAVVLGLVAAVAWGRWWWLIPLIALALSIVGLMDLRQTRHSILRNYPVIGPMRFLLEFIRPEMRQYFIEGEHEALPFSRAQRSLVYQRSKGESDSRPFGTLLDVAANGYEWINHSMTPTQVASQDFRVWIGGQPGQPLAGKGVCTQPYHASVFNISAMSFGSMSANAILALNLGARTGGFAHDTGEGSISQHHRVHSGDLIWQIASGYFGCRNPDGTFSEERFVANAADPQVKMIELKISQGAKPGHGGMLLGAKVTAEIAAARGVPMGVDCISPSSHSAFHTPVEMLEFLAKLRRLSGGKPTGMKLCVGHPWEWFAMVKAMMETDITPDFIVVDGAEGGTGAAPVEFTDHVGVPLQEGLLLVHNTLIGVNLRHRVQIGAAAKVITAFDIARMMALGADWCNAGRGFMMALGCIQALTCHTGHCPTGVTTQDARRQKALVVPDKGTRVANFHRSTMHALKELVQAAGLQHPGQITAHHIVRRTNDSQVHQLANTVLRVEPGALLGPLDEQHNVFKMYWGRASAQTFQIAPPPLQPSAAAAKEQGTIA
jgi:glutamate synthase domain-containing protein 2